MADSQETQQLAPMALVRESLDALSRLDAERLERLGEAAETLRRQQAGVATEPRVSQAAAREVMALRELVRFTSQRLGVLETLHRERATQGGDAAPAWRDAWAR